MELDDIMDCAAEVLGTELTQAQRTVLERCCTAARASCLSRLQGEVTQSARPAVLQACGTLAAGLFLEQTEPDEVAAFTAGKLSVTTRSVGQDRAGRLKALAMELLAPYAASGFAFLGVRG